MKSFEKPWFVAGGWAIDLAVGKATREHKDIDICVFREDANYTINYFKDWDIKVAIPGEHRLERVDQITDVVLPRYCLHLFKDNEFLEILLTERVREEVVFRKNSEIRMSIKDFSKHQENIPFVNPVWQLLFKSLNTREEDEHDFMTYINEVNDDYSKKWLFQKLKDIKGNQKWIEELQKYFSKIEDIL
ncbi:nucleotidyltransferase domain-containing protein [Paenibacillus puldeungensis]|uniref:Nucleotidyltransferase domain-containing protein n=1 Tax=Paenibacillus puldeungensis TaxID=696536 RepID=A0ABW3RUN1_9BACL